MYSSFLRKIILPLADRLRRYPFIDTLKEYEKTQWYTRQEIKEYQDDKLRRLIKHVYENVPYYNNIMKERKLIPSDICTSSDLVKLPILTKEDVRSHAKELVAKNYRNEELFACQTGGSTGKPLQLFKDLNTHVWSTTALYRGLSWGGYELGDPIVRFTGISLGEIPRGWVERMKGKICRMIFLPSFEISEQNVREYLRKIRRSRAKFARGYASASYLLAKLMGKLKIDDLNFETVFTTAEVLQDFQRTTIEKQFKCKVLDYYGGGEVNSLAYQCEKRLGHHIVEEHVIIESVRGNVEPVIDRTGEFLVTDIDNYGMPFIRYKNEDAGIISSQLCSCGRGLRLIKALHGRVNDLLVSYKGDLLPSQFFPSLFVVLRINGIDQFQIIQETKEYLILRIVKNKNFNRDELDRVLSIIHKYMGQEVVIEVKEVSSIPTAPSGKKRYTISKIASKLL